MADDEISAVSAFICRRGAILEGTFPRDTGSYTISSCRVRFGWGVIPNDAWPHATFRSRPEPPGLDALAKAQRIPVYCRVTNIQEYMKCLRLCPIIAAFPVTHDWFYALNGHIASPAPNTPVIGTHTLAMLGFSMEEGVVKFINSWGNKWGDNGFGSMSFDFFERHLQEAWFCLPGKTTFPSGTGIMHWEHGHHTPLGIAHVIEYYDVAADERLAWAIVLQRDNCLDLQDLFVKPQHRGRGIATKLIHGVKHLRKETVRPSLPLTGLIHPVDAGMFLEPIRKLTIQLGLDLGDSIVPWGRYIVRPVGKIWRSHRRKRHSSK